MDLINLKKISLTFSREEESYFAYGWAFSVQDVRCCLAPNIKPLVILI